jgi:hypothetical protein
MIAADHRILTPDTRQVDWTQPVNWRDPLNDGLVSWWLAVPNHTAGGATWRDLCQRNDGTLTNFANVDQAWKTQGQPGGFGALEFDGSDDYVVCGSNTLATGALTVSVWAKASTPQLRAMLNVMIGPYGLIVYYGSSSGGTQSTMIGFRVDGEMHTASDTVPSGVWHHLVYVFAGGDTDTASEFSIYIDGVASAVSRFGGIGGSTSDNRIGWDGSAFDGEIADVRIWDRALAASEIQDYYHRSQRYYPGLLNRHTRRSIFLPAAAEPDTGTGGSRRVVIPTVSTPDTRHVDWRDPVADHSLNDGLISWWLAVPNHTAGTSTWRDLCGKNDGTLTAYSNVDQAWKTQGQPGGFGALEFDGSDDGVIAANNPATDWPVTVSAWFRVPVSGGEVLAAIVNTGAWTESAILGVGDPSGHLTVDNARGGWGAQLVGSTVVGTGWRHGAVVWGAGNTRRLFLDGQLDGSDALGMDYPVGADAVSLGYLARIAPVSYFTGEIADVRIWDRALTSSEVQSYYDLSSRYYPALLNRHTRRSIFLPITTGVTISPDTLTMTGSLQGAPPTISRTINVT